MADENEKVGEFASCKLEHQEILRRCRWTCLLAFILNAERPHWDRERAETGDSQKNIASVVENHALHAACNQEPASCDHTFA